MNNLEKRVRTMIISGLLDGEPYDDVKDYIEMLEVRLGELEELQRYKIRYNNIVYALTSDDEKMVQIAIDCCKSGGAEKFEMQLKALRGNNIEMQKQ